MITDLPNHLRGEHALATHFEKMDLPVESVSLCRELGRLHSLIERRTDALLKLEAAWTKYVGNPSSVEEYDPSMNVRSDPSTTQLVDAGDEEAQRVRLVVPHRSRPTIRSSWFGKKHDALEYLATQFKAADEAVLRERRSAKLQSTGTAFVTFETMSGAVGLVPGYPLCVAN
jgi:calcium permeable stress-gated cation channel